MVAAWRRLDMSPEGRARARAQHEQDLEALELEAPCLPPFSPDEPRLAPRDHALWSAWQQTASRHARTLSFRRAWDRARAVIEQARSSHPHAHLALSGGKDSAALGELLSMLGLAPIAMTLLDDLDFPGHEAYVSRLAQRWGTQAAHLWPSFSVQRWLWARRGELDPFGDFAGDGSVTARSFFDLVRAWEHHTSYSGVFLGLRAQESANRRRLYVMRGASYTRSTDGQAVYQPFATWSELDVWALLVSREVEPHPVYRCLRFHAGNPCQLRLDGWLPGAHAPRGQGVWLKTYYPSIWRRLQALMPGIGRAA